MRLISWWMGTDALTLNKFPPANKIWYLKLLLYRIKWKLIHNKFNEHWIDHERLRIDLLKFGVNPSKIKVVPDKLLYVEKFPKLEHTGFNVLFYIPRKPANLGGMKFLHWLYGYDIYVALKEHFKTDRRIAFLVVDGGYDMSVVYPIVDLYIRPTRHDGAGRMLKECEINDIPCLHSADGDPIIERFVKSINLLKP
jgi:hypothetical protein